MSDVARLKWTSSGFVAAADSLLYTSTKLWLVVTLGGMWIFVIYLGGYYGSIILTQGWDGLYATYMPHGFIRGDTTGNIAISTHIVVAMVAMACGSLQFIPKIRTRTPDVHRWAGRIFLFAACLGSISGVYLTWARPVEHVLQAVAISLNAILILAFATMTLRYAIARKIATHHRWAVRLFLVVVAPLFLRLGYTLWFHFADRYGLGSEHLFDVLNFAQYLLPLAIFELYLHARARTGAVGRCAMAAVLAFTTALMSFGVYLASTGMWLRAISMG